MAALISQPLRRSVALARRLAAGDLQARLRPKGNNEIAELGRALDDMADALGTKLAELDQAAERERRFSADVAHELRTPITGLVAAASLLDDSPEAAMVRERASALAALVEDLLEVMRLESGSEEVRVERFDLVRLVRDVAAPARAGRAASTPRRGADGGERPAARGARAGEPAGQRGAPRPAAGVRDRAARRQR